MHQLIKAESGISEDQASISPDFPGSELILKTEFSTTYLQVTLGIFMVLSTAFLAVLLKENKYLKTVTELIPESGMMLFFGAVVAFIIGGGDVIAREVSGSEGILISPIYLSHNIVQHVLIAPIILHASYEVYHPHFFGQIDKILIMAFVGTILNTIIIGLSLRYIFGPMFPDMNLFHCMTFAPIIAAVDPVAVLAVFEVVNAEKALYFLVFGEALLNDAVTFVLYEGIRELAPIPTEDMSSTPAMSYVYVLLSFLTAPLGGALIGFVCGLASAFITKHTSESTAVFKPMIAILFGVVAYGLTIVFGYSNILGIIAYGITQERYTFGNMTVKASILTSNIVHTVGIIFEELLFFILGAEFAAVGFYAVWDFALVVIFIITVSRIIVTCGLCLIINKFTSKRPINWRWQILIIVGGLRGAIAFAMVVTYEGPFQKLFYDSCLVVIFFTTIANGILAKPLVNYLGLKAEAGVKTDYSKYYGHDEYQPGFLGKCWSKFDKTICRIFTKEKAMHDAITKELKAGENKEAFKKLQKVKHSNE